MPTSTRIRAIVRTTVSAIILTALAFGGTSLRIRHAVAGDVYVAPASIESDCSRNVAAELEAWFDTVPDGSVIELRPDACYRTDDPVTLEDRHDITFLGRGATMKAFTDGDLYRRHFHIRGGSNIIVRNLTVVGANPQAGLSDDAWSASHAFQHGFTLAGVQGVILEHVRVFDVYGDFVYVGQLDGTPSRDVTITDSTFRRNGRQGITIASGEHIDIVRNRIWDVRMAMIDLEPMNPQWHVQDVLVKNNILGTRRLTMLSAATRGDVDDVAVIGNEVEGSLRTGIESRTDGVRYSGFLFQDNVAGSRHVGQFAVMKFRNVDDISIIGNQQRIADEALVSLSGSCHVRVNDNVIDGASEPIAADDTSCDYSAEGNET